MLCSESHLLCQLPQGFSHFLFYQIRCVWFNVEVFDASGVELGRGDKCTSICIPPHAAFQFGQQHRRCCCLFPTVLQLHKWSLKCLCLSYFAMCNVLISSIVSFRIIASRVLGTHHSESRAYCMSCTERARCGKGRHLTLIVRGRHKESSLAVQSSKSLNSSFHERDPPSKCNVRSDKSSQRKTGVPDSRTLQHTPMHV